jgi:hypothetical protein
VLDEQRDAALENRPSVDRQQLLGHCRAESFAAAAGRDNR